VPRHGQSGHRVPDADKEAQRGEASRRQPSVEYAGKSRPDFPGNIRRGAGHPSGPWSGTKQIAGSGTKSAAAAKANLWTAP